MRIGFPLTRSTIFHLFELLIMLPPLQSFFTQPLLFCGGTSLFISNCVPYSFSPLFAMCISKKNRLESDTRIIIANDVYQNSWCSAQKPTFHGFYLWLSINLFEWTEKIEIRICMRSGSMHRHDYSIISSTIKFSRTTYAPITQSYWSTDFIMPHLNYRISKYKVRLIDLQ